MAKIYQFPVKKPIVKKATVSDWLFWVGLYAIMLTRFFYKGLVYFPFADDNNQYGVYYRKSADIWNNIIMYYKNFTSRPLAIFSDAYIIMRFWNNMWFVVIVFTTLHFFSCYFLFKALRNSGIKFGVVGISLFTLTPVLYEAVYWVSASSRLVAGMFFALLSIWVFTVFIDKLNSGSKYSGSLFSCYWFFNLVSMGYYEQVVVFSFTATLIFVFINRDRLPKFSRVCSYSVPIFNVFAIGAYYIYFMFFNNLNSDNRGEPALSGFLEHVKETASDTLQLLTEQLDMLVYSFSRGLDIASAHEGLIAVILVIVLCGFLSYALFAKKLIIEECDGNNKFTLRVVIGLLLTIMPFIIFFLLSNSYVSTRSLFPSFAGIAILIDTAFDAVSKFYISIKGKKFGLFKLKAFIMPAIIIPFFIMWLSIIDIFEENYNTNTTIANEFINTFANSGYELKDAEHQNGKILIFNSKAQYNSHLPVMYNSLAVDWLFLGKLNAISDKYFFTNISLIRDGNWFQSDWPEMYPSFGVDEEMNFFELVLNDDSSVLLIKDTGEWFGDISTSIFYRDIH